MPLSFIVFFLIKYLSCFPSFPQQSLLPLSPQCQSPGRRSLISFLSPAPLALRFVLPRFPFESLVLSVEKKDREKRERHINLIKRVLLLAVWRHFLWQYRWQRWVLCVCEQPKAPFGDPSLGLSVSQQSKDTQCCGVLQSATICVCVCVCVLVCVDSVLWNAEGNRTCKIKDGFFFYSKCAGIFVHIHHCLYILCVCASIITSCFSDQRHAPLSVLLIFLFFLATEKSWIECNHNEQIKNSS